MSSANLGEKFLSLRGQKKFGRGTRAEQITRAELSDRSALVLPCIFRVLLMWRNGIVLPICHVFGRISATIATLQVHPM
jgi:hypothetical protein